MLQSHTALQVPLLSLEEHVQAETSALVPAFIQTHLTRKGNEKIDQAIDVGDFASAQSIILEEINGLKVARSRLAAESDRFMGGWSSASGYDEERCHVEADRVSLELSVSELKHVMHYMQNLFSKVEVSSKRRQEFDHIYIRF